MSYQSEKSAKKMLENGGFEQLWNPVRLRTQSLLALKYFYDILTVKECGPSLMVALEVIFLANLGTFAHFRPFLPYGFAQHFQEIPK